MRRDYQIFFWVQIDAPNLLEVEPGCGWASGLLELLLLLLR